MSILFRNTEFWASVDPQQVKKYLLAKGWKEIIPERSGVPVALYRHADEVDGPLLYLHLDRSQPKTYAMGLASTIETLSIAEDRPSVQVLLDVAGKEAVWDEITRVVGASPRVEQLGNALRGAVQVLVDVGRMEHYPASAAAVEKGIEAARAVLGKG